MTLSNLLNIKYLSEITFPSISATITIPEKWHPMEILKFLHPQVSFQDASKLLHCGKIYFYVPGILLIKYCSVLEA